MFVGLVGCLGLVGLVVFVWLVCLVWLVGWPLVWFSRVRSCGWLDWFGWLVGVYFGLVVFVGLFGLVWFG